MVTLLSNRRLRVSIGRVSSTSKPLPLVLVIHIIGFICQDTATVRPTDTSTTVAEKTALIHQDGKSLLRPLQLTCSPSPTAPREASEALVVLLLLLHLQWPLEVN